jgi:hypothetical protein
MAADMRSTRRAGYSRWVAVAGGIVTGGAALIGAAYLAHDAEYSEAADAGYDPRPRSAGSTSVSPQPLEAYCYRALDDLGASPRRASCGRPTYDEVHASMATFAARWRSQKCDADAGAPIDFCSRCLGMTLSGGACGELRYLFLGEARGGETLYFGESGDLRAVQEYADTGARNYGTVPACARRRAFILCDEGPKDPPE